MDREYVCLSFALLSDGIACNEDDWGRDGYNNLYEWLGGWAPCRINGETVLILVHGARLQGAVD